nr:hypothetical protein [Clostridium estertheticum]
MAITIPILETVSPNPLLNAFMATFTPILENNAKTKDADAHNYI